MAKTYHDEMQTEVDSIKVSQQKIDKRYDSKFEILSDKIAKIEKTVSSIENRSSQQRADSDVMFEDVRVEVQSLRGSMEEAEHNMKTRESNIDKSISDLDDRTRDLESKFDLIMAHLEKLKNVLGIKDKATDKSRDKNGSDDISEYDSAVKTLTSSKDYPLAERKLKKFIKDYPSSSLADNAQYWLAESFYARGDFKTASSEFDKVTRDFPNSDKKCGAMLKQGFSYDNMGQKDMTQVILRKVIKECPDTSEAKMALERMKSIPEKVQRIVE